jgi:hypothetical protein
MPEIADKFFEAEGFGTEHKSQMTLSELDKAVWTDIQDGIQKLPDGPGYEVKLPWKKDVPALLNNRVQAEKRLDATLSKLNKNEKDNVDYCKAMEKNIDEGYAKHVYDYDPKVPSVKALEPGQYFLPHHAVCKKGGGKLRVVFDSAATTRDGTSLNDHLHNGPKLQSDLPTILLMHRENEVAYCADVEAISAE